MIKKIVLVVVAVLVALFVYAGLKSPDYMVQRQVTINAPAGKVFPYLNNMKLAEQWGPWKEMDPATKMTLSGPDAGVGAKSSWAGGTEMGTGSATIVESVPDSKVGLRLEYTEPMSMVQNAEYLLQSTGAESTVTWKVSGQNNFVARLMCLFVDMDKMVGGMFEKGLAKLKSVAEKA